MIFILLVFPHQKLVNVQLFLRGGFNLFHLKFPGITLNRSAKGFSFFRIFPETY